MLRSTLIPPVSSACLTAAGLPQNALVGARALISAVTVNRARSTFSQSAPPASYRSTSRVSDCVQAV